MVDPIQNPNEADLYEGLAWGSTPFSETADYAPLLELAGESRFVLIGEATHGTHEFYHHRASITRRLIEEKQFNAVMIEADWPDAYKVNQYVQGLGGDADAAEALSGFRRFPQWMWRNADVLDFVGWLRDYNDALPPRSNKVGFYGMDLYSLYGSIQAVLAYLDRVDPQAAKRARYRYGCFEHFRENAQAYGYAAGFDLSASCEREVIDQLLELRQSAGKYARQDGRIAEDEYFYARQNARLVRNAEGYYRSMFHGRVSSWNLRDQHMVETIEALAGHLDRHMGRSKIVVWAHNSHLGDARATEMGRGGELNVGQLMRERHGEDVVLIGFSTYAGTVTAASRWDGPAERKVVLPGLPDSYESLFHQAFNNNALMLLSNHRGLRGILIPPRLQRAIGVIYLPQTERLSHYFHTVLPDQFDAMIHIDHSRAVEPLERSAQWEQGEAPQTYPTGV